MEEIAAHFAPWVKNKPYVRHLFFLFYINNSNENAILQVSSFPLFILTGYYSPALVISLCISVTENQKKKKKKDSSILLRNVYLKVMFHNINHSKVYISSKVKSQYLYWIKRVRELK